MGKQAFENAEALFVFLPLSIAGVLLCITWRRIIRNYRQLNAAKLDVIHCLEDHLPASLFKAEWVALGGGTDPKKYQSISKTEANVAAVFIILYSITILGAVVVLYVNLLLYRLGFISNFTV